MDSLSSAFSSSKGGSPAERKAALKNQVTSEMAMQNVSRRRFEGWRAGQRSILIYFQIY
jgi:hypothetical protein